jgi:hypothetical protein
VCVCVCVCLCVCVCVCVCASVHFIFTTYFINCFWLLCKGTHKYFSWRIMSSELDDCFYCLFLTITIMIPAHNQWLSKNRPIPYWTTSVFSSTATELILIYESITSSASVVRQVTLNFWMFLRLPPWNLWRINYFEVEVNVTLRLTVGQSVSQSVSKSSCRAPSGAHDQIFITV